MTPKDYFNSAWQRCEQLAVLYAYLEKNVSSALTPDEILRAEWVARVSCLDLYVHELVAQRMLAIFDGHLAASNGYMKFKLSNDTLHRIRAATSPIAASAAFDLEIRQQLSFLSFQDPEKIADAIRMFSGIELWNEVALHLGATQATKVEDAKFLRSNLSLIAQRRNKIAHEGDLQPVSPRQPWPINSKDLEFVRDTISKTVTAIDAVV